MWCLHKPFRLHHRNDVHGVKTLYRIRILRNEFLFARLLYLDIFCILSSCTRSYIVLNCCYALLNRFLFSFLFFFRDQLCHLNAYMHSTTEGDRNNDCCVDRPVFVSTFKYCQPLVAKFLIYLVTGSKNRYVLLIFNLSSFLLVSMEGEGLCKGVDVFTNIKPHNHRSHLVKIKMTDRYDLINPFLSIFD